MPGGRHAGFRAGGKWDLTVLAPDCALEDGREIAPGVMLDRYGKEVLK